MQTLIKDGDHRLSSHKYLALMGRLIDEIVQEISEEEKEEDK